ncbi:hypothetical protein FPQ18DRAFT_8127 [Pyronema domesticum]|nr:hypothetical protein FPQ18DRAFT_8127 [Pyronema domesticum]
MVFALIVRLWVSTNVVECLYDFFESLSKLSELNFCRTCRASFQTELGKLVYMISLGVSVIPINFGGGSQRTVPISASCLSRTTRLGTLATSGRMCRS